MQLSEILRWLDAWGCASKHEDTLELRQPDTCTWLPDINEYKKWRSVDNPFLWLHGKRTYPFFQIFFVLTLPCLHTAGSGKSVLAYVDGLHFGLKLILPQCFRDRQPRTHTP